MAHSPPHKNPNLLHKQKQQVPETKLQKKARGKQKRAQNIELHHAEGMERRRMRAAKNRQGGHPP